MFVRIKRNKSKTSAAIQIVENRRVGSTTKQQVIRHVGTALTEEEIGPMKRLAESIKVQLENEAISTQSKNSIPKFASGVGQVTSATQNRVEMSNISEVSRQVLGIHDIYGSLYDQLGYTNLFTRPQKREPDAKILREIVLARIARPLSKRASVEMLETEFGVSLDLDDVYRMMDKIDDAFCDRIQRRALSETLKLTGGKLRVLFYDCTTLYFESFTEDELKQNGYSKDLKFNQPQVLLALFVTENGLPVGYELFPGSTFEGHTLVPVLEKLKARYKIEDVVFVADRGLLSEENLKQLDEKGFKYIVGARIKNVSKKLQTDILNEENYEAVELKLNPNKIPKKPVIQRIAVFEQGAGRKLVVHYHSSRAKKDECDRRKAIERLHKKLSKSKDPKSLINNYGSKKYLKITGDTQIELDEEKITAEAKWDGLLGVTTNMESDNPEKLFAHYRGLWQIEESFRINKHDLKMRPIYHWKPHRVKAHIAISFIAFVCVRYLEYVVSLRTIKMSPEVIRKSLLRVQASIIQDEESGKQFLLPSALPDEARKIYKIVGIKIPPKACEIQCGA